MTASAAPPETRSAIAPASAADSPRPSARAASAAASVQAHLLRRRAAPTRGTPRARARSRAARRRTPPSRCPDRASADRERIPHEVGEDAAHLVAAQDDDEQAREPDGRHRGDGVLGGRGAALACEAADDGPECAADPPPARGRSRSRRRVPTGVRFRGVVRAWWCSFLWCRAAGGWVARVVTASRGTAEGAGDDGDEERRDAEQHERGQHADAERQHEPHAEGGRRARVPSARATRRSRKASARRSSATGAPGARGERDHGVGRPRRRLPRAPRRAPSAWRTIRRARSTEAPPDIAIASSSSSSPASAS